MASKDGSGILERRALTLSDYPVLIYRKGGELLSMLIGVFLLLRFFEGDVSILFVIVGMIFVIIPTYFLIPVLRDMISGELICLRGIIDVTQIDRDGRGRYPRFLLTIDGESFRIDGSIAKKLETGSTCDLEFLPRSRTILRYKKYDDSQKFDH